ncbi:MAG: DUF1015 domain-containing protein [Firmicutes bacterium]|nr:DUF1015 domain-containing protein [Bacillota bacterium]
MDLPVNPARFLLPRQGIDLYKWAVVACDQHTSDTSYWEALEQLVGGSPSSLRLIYPEVYLGNAEENMQWARKISANMRFYLLERSFIEYSGLVSVERTLTSNGKTRKGILLAIDLETYDFMPGAKPLVRASEGTVMGRLPPRVEIRKACPLELPHIMLLYDDPDFSVQKAVENASGSVLYDFDLNMGGGHICGTHLAKKDCGPVLDAFSALLDASQARYGERMLFAVGDGNHSLAAAKLVYDEAKAQGQGEECRFALCEAVNLYDPALDFQPIHRLVKATDPQAFLSELTQNMPSDPIKAVAYADKFAKSAGFEVDYVHGDRHLAEAAKKLAAAPVFLKAIDKSEFFPYIIKNGSLPKKTFSMGEAEDKRYYLEAARIKI